MGSSPKLIWSIQITCLLLNLTDPRSVAGNAELGDAVRGLNDLLESRTITVTQADLSWKARLVQKTKGRARECAAAVTLLA